jgi:aminoglycoside 6'-N-acetyltransferase I
MDRLRLHHLKPSNQHLLERIAEGVFDKPVRPDYLAEFLAGQQNVMYVAVLEADVVGMASGLIYNHPDKPKHFWLNEIAVATTHRRQGIGRALLQAMTAHAQANACQELWLLTESENVAANALYQAGPNWQGPKPQVMYWVDLPEP